MRATKPRTQRKRLFQSSPHLYSRYFSAALSPDLKLRHSTNAYPLRRGDTVRVMRGDRKGFEGKITKVNRRKRRIFIEGVTREKVDGTAIQIPIHPSKVVITNLNLDDKLRRETIKQRKSPAIVEKKAEPKTKLTKQPPEEPKRKRRGKETRVKTTKRKQPKSPPKRRKKGEEMKEATHTTRARTRTRSERVKKAETGQTTKES